MSSKQKSRADRARDIALCRYSLVRALADPALSPTERGTLVRELAAQVHLGPSGEPATEWIPPDIEYIKLCPRLPEPLD